MRRITRPAGLEQTLQCGERGQLPHRDDAWIKLMIPLTTVWSGATKEERWMRIARPREEGVRLRSVTLLCFALRIPTHNGLHKNWHMRISMIVTRAHHGRNLTDIHMRPGSKRMTKSEKETDTRDRDKTNALRSESTGMKD